MDILTQYDRAIADFLDAVEAAVDRRKVSPGTLIQYAAKAHGQSRWNSWRSGESTPTRKTMAKILDYISA